MPKAPNPADVEGGLVGVWDLASWYETGLDGQVTHVTDARGKLIYTAEGHVSAQLVRMYPGRFRSDDMRRASDGECVAAWKGYFGYFGTYTADPLTRTVTHQIEGASFPNLTGTDQVRHYHFEDSQLILDADWNSGRVRVIWKRSES